jgi:hypothetical protein
MTILAIFYHTLLALALCGVVTDAFYGVSMKSAMRIPRPLHAVPKKPMLDQSTLWQINLKLQRDSYKDVLVGMRVRFLGSFSGLFLDISSLLFLIPML